MGLMVVQRGVNGLKAADLDNLNGSFYGHFATLYKNTNKVPSWTEYHLRTQEILQTPGQSVGQTLLNDFP